jgi:hypothetical protein
LGNLSDHWLSLDSFTSIWKIGADFYGHPLHCNTLDPAFRLCPGLRLQQI